MLQVKKRWEEDRHIQDKYCSVVKQQNGTYTVIIYCSFGKEKKFMWLYESYFTALRRLIYECKKRNNFPAYVRRDRETGRYYPIEGMEFKGYPGVPILEEKQHLYQD